MGIVGAPIAVPEAGLKDLRARLARLARVRWPEKEPVRDWSQGAHFAAFEQPALFVEELRAGFRHIR